VRGWVEALRHDPALIPNAVDEMIRWVTPVRHVLRQAQADYDLDGHTIGRGEWLLLPYLSANRGRRPAGDTDDSTPGP
jgi:cytochrome P450